MPCHDAQSIQYQVGMFRTTTSQQRRDLRSIPPGQNNTSVLAHMLKKCLDGSINSSDDRYQ
jgi:hypothetical protein